MRSTHAVLDTIYSIFSSGVASSGILIHRDLVNEQAIFSVRLEQSPLGMDLTGLRRSLQSRPLFL